ncbi:MAG: 50S ribosomal protein L30 [Myxococcales bacterium]|jgi:large subunit ribosomal protein L30|nr:50S ribosomal protein L30 [Myxococcales bacterium]
MKPKLRVTQTKSTIAEPQRFRLNLKGLGLRGVGSQVVVDNTPSFRGAVKRVLHLVKVEEVDNG